MVDAATDSQIHFHNYGIQLGRNKTKMHHSLLKPKHTPTQSQKANRVPSGALYGSEIQIPVLVSYHSRFNCPH